MITRTLPITLGFTVKKYMKDLSICNPDIIASLEWVHKEIRNFGGDSRRVTL